MSRRSSKWLAPALSMLITFTAPMAAVLFDNVLTGEVRFILMPIRKDKWEPRKPKNLWDKFHLWLDPHADAADVPEIRCIIGEAAAEGKTGMLAVAEAIRNRGHLKGVYGCRASFVDSEPEWVWQRAREAWEKSKTSNLVKGADHWHSTDEETAWWEKYGTLTVVIGKHKFYKEVNK